MTRHLYRWSDNYSPCSIFLNSLYKTFSGQLFQLLIYCCDVDAHFIRQFLDGNVWNSIHKVENLAR